MAILVNKETRVLTQGITGATGQFHTKACKEYGTQMVAGVTPGRGGTSFEEIPIFETVAVAIASTNFAPARMIPECSASDPTMNPETSCTNNNGV